mmetsp:Transcript_27457/g.80452  ORF Transcript_27457/g.80452 Transcript_27457/m.80452 type:complete len:278 (-) Transcript_27457:381-1214(-)
MSVTIGSPTPNIHRDLSPLRHPRVRVGRLTLCLRFFPRHLRVEPVRLRLRLVTVLIRIAERFYYPVCDLVDAPAEIVLAAVHVQPSSKLTSNNPCPVFGVLHLGVHDNRNHALHPLLQQGQVKLELCVVILPIRSVTVHLHHVGVRDENDDRPAAIDTVCHLNVDVATQAILIEPGGQTALLQRAVDRGYTLMIVSAKTVRHPRVGKERVEQQPVLEGIILLLSRVLLRACFGKLQQVSLQLGVNLGERVVSRLVKLVQLTVHGRDGDCCRCQLVLV